MRHFFYIILPIATPLSKLLSLLSITFLNETRKVGKWKVPQTLSRYYFTITFRRYKKLRSSK